jgi:hypothetical protein
MTGFNALSLSSDLFWSLKKDQKRSDENEREIHVAG